MMNFVESYCEFPAAFRRPMWRIWHNLLIRFDRDSAVNFMNYGYADLSEGEPVKLESKDERDRYCIQLYDHVVKKVDLKNKKVLEVGSGRGGGANYIARYYKPGSYTGIDISEAVIRFCNRFYKVPGLSFLMGRAEKIPVSSESVDSVVNVESARCYSNIETFFREVYRVLHPNGHFLFADMIGKGEVDKIRKKLERNGFIIQSENEITRNVVRGLELDNQRRSMLIKTRIPGFLKSLFESFAGTKGSKRFESFHNGNFEYWSFVLVKN